ncbi:MAG: hypothetical protein WCE38_16620, partial [Burkholderiales bacterium]
RSRGRGRDGGTPVNRLPLHLALLLLVLLSACATRSSQTEVPAAPGVLAESDVDRLVALWQDRLCRYIVEEGNGDDEVLSRLSDLRSRNTLRPARITFGVLDAEAAPPERHGWDIQGVLVGMQRNGLFIRYIFVVGIVGYTGYLPTRVQDIRLIGLSHLGKKFVWETSMADTAAVERYRETFAGRGASRFPGDDDNFRMNARRDQVSVQEIRSGAGWTLAARAGQPVLAGAAHSHTSFVREVSSGCAGVE